MIVIGGSLGSMAALRTILQHLPATLAAPIAVVLHRHRESEDALVPLLQRETALPVSEVVDKDPVRAGQIHVAPCDYHLLVEPMYFSLSTDDPVQYARPSIDVLFESTADVFGPRSLGVILTGANRDGAQGAAEMRRRGATIIVQDPATAESRVMPEAALATVPDALVRGPLEIGELLVTWASKGFLP
jgi:two-component system chemotaxis response regulator CheB